MEISDQVGVTWNVKGFSAAVIWSFIFLSDFLFTPWKSSSLFNHHLQDGAFGLSWILVIRFQKMIFVFLLFFYVIVQISSLGLIEQPPLQCSQKVRRQFSSWYLCYESWIWLTNSTPVSLLGLILQCPNK